VIADEKRRKLLKLR